MQVRVTCGLAIMCLLVASAVAGEEWEILQCPAADQDVDFRYEKIRPITTFENELGSWQAFSGTQQTQTTVGMSFEVKHGGESSLRADYEFFGDKDLEYVEFGPDLKIKEPGLGLGLWVKGDGTPLAMRIRVVDKSGECHQFNLGQLRTNEWEYMACSFNKGGHWGGDGNGKLDYPCRLHSVLGDKPCKGYKGTGSLWIDDVYLVKRRKGLNGLTIEVADKRLGNLYANGETIQLRANGKGDLRWVVEDFTGTALDQGKGMGQVEIKQSLRSGWYRCQIDLLADGKLIDSKVARFAVLPKTLPTERNPVIGVCTHFQRAKLWPIKGMDLLVEYGITEIRDEIGWGHVERERGKLSVPEKNARFTHRAKELGIHTHMIFDYANRFYDDGGFPNSEEAIAGFANYARFMATTMRDRINTWEVWNEWSMKCGMRGRPGSNAPEHYGRLLEVTYKAVKKAVPEATIVGIGGEHSQRHFDNIQVMMKRAGGSNMDAFSVHSYRYPRAPEVTDLYGEIQRVAELARECGAPAKVWVTEIGWPTHLDGRGVTERVQAWYAVRTLALLAATGIVEKVYWYDFKNDGTNREYNENNFGIVWHQKYNWAPKPAALAMSVYLRTTVGLKALPLWQKSGCYAVYYKRPDGSDLVIAWSARGDKPVKLSGVSLSVRDLMGNSVQGLVSALTETPVYITGKNVKIKGPTS